MNLRDAEAIDPEFADRLRASGVTGNPSDFGKALGKTALMPDQPKPPANQAPQGGVPFGKGLPAGLGRPRADSSDAAILAVFAAGGLAAGGAWMLSRKPKRR
ncbi:hypothetical protein [Nannocystis pusilla]|uniref:hypothetical protein n=1 Tax=Nannocystis pusilla TaxID=889268 RepID=UPI003B78FBA7